jgi:hypothetical protein
MTNQIIEDNIKKYFPEISDYCNYHRGVKNIIRKIAIEVQQEERKRILEGIKNNIFYKTGITQFAQGYNQALEDIEKIIKEDQKVEVDKRFKKL